jgi:hypothetical protein
VFLVLISIQFQNLIVPLIWQSLIVNNNLLLLWTRQVRRKSIWKIFRICKDLITPL